MTIITQENVYINIYNQNIVTIKQKVINLNLVWEVIIMAKSRLVGKYPVIGIRPTIDGRRGIIDVRGSLEEQTMNMAKSAKKAFRGKFKIFKWRKSKGYNS